MWYLQKKGKTEGPIPDATLIRAIEKGDIGPLDLLFKEGEDRWRAAAEFESLREHFQLAHGPDTTNEDEWIILSKVKETKSFKQKGPFKTSDVKRKLKTGEVLWSDYAWREGMKEWYRITALEIFHGEAPDMSSEDVVTKTSPKLSQKEVLDNVEILQRPKMPMSEERPPEAVGPDLTQKVKAPAEVPKKEAKKESKKPVARPKVDPEVTQTNVFARRLSIWDRFQEMSPSQKWLISTAFLFLIMGSAITALFWNSYQDYVALHLVSSRQAAPSLQPPQPVEAAPVIQEPVVEVLPEKAPEAPVVAAPVEKNVAPSTIKAVVRGNKSAEPILEIQTNASSHYPMTLKIVGRLGSVIGARSYYRQIRLKTLDERKVDLKKYSLRAGFYDVQVQFEGENERLRSQASLEVRTSEKDFRGELNNHRKGLTHWSVNERVQLIKLASRAEEQLGDFLKQQRVLKDKSSALRDYFRSWQKRFNGITSQTLKTINSRNRNNYVYAENWLELKSLKQKIVDQAGATARAKDANQAAQILQALRSSKEDLSRLKERIITLSMWK